MSKREVNRAGLLKSDGTSAGEGETEGMERGKAWDGVEGRDLTGAGLGMGERV